MKRLHLIINIILGCLVFPLKSQDVSYHIPLDSANVINNAVVIRTTGSNTEYIMMPTQFGTDIANGQLLCVKVDASLSSTFVSIRFYRNLSGLVVTDMAVGKNDTINFSGYRNGTAVYGTLDPSDNIHVTYDNTTLYSKAIFYRNFSGTGYLLTGDQWNSSYPKLAAFTSSTTLSFDTASYFRNQMTIVDVVLSQHSNKSSAYGISLCRTSSQKMAFARHNLNNLGTSILTRKIVTPPTHWTWHEGGGSIVRISADRYVAAIDMRCDTAEKDGVWLVKFSVGTTFTIYGTQLLEFPAQKVIVKDMYCVNDANRGNKLCIVGQYIDPFASSPWHGCPFVIQTDTTLVNSTVKEYATHYPDYGHRNFQLNKLDYNKPFGIVIGAGSYCKYGTAYPTGGIYLSVIDPFSTTTPTFPCAFPLTVVKLPHTFSLSNMMQMANFSPVLSNFNHPCLPYLNSIQILLDCIPARPKENTIANTQHSKYFYQDGEKIVLQNIDGTADYAIFDMSGKVAMKGSTASSISISHLKSGLYIIHITVNNKIVATEKFVK